MEYEFGEGDHRQREGGGPESHSKLRNELLYRASDSKTKIKDAREAILALAPDDFIISLSTYFTRRTLEKVHSKQDVITKDGE